ncbi:hypothetical protein CRENBAI_018479 [Crenichthys baileyi]|uniref:Uncharacterized protein n=1 Tax=Crenichthys baileyi TaxID=28760 RepID=A0AAV9S482_9TELE
MKTSREHRHYRREEIKKWKAAGESYRLPADIRKGCNGQRQERDGGLSAGGGEDQEEGQSNTALDAAADNIAGPEEPQAGTSGISGARVTSGPPENLRSLLSALHVASPRMRLGNLFTELRFSVSPPQMGSACWTGSRLTCRGSPGGGGTCSKRSWRQVCLL